MTRKRRAYDSCEIRRQSRSRLLRCEPLEERLCLAYWGFSYSFAAGVLTFEGTNPGIGRDGNDEIDAIYCPSRHNSGRLAA